MTTALLGLILIGGAVILQWAWSLMRTTSHVLLDAEPTPGLAAKVRGAIETDRDNRVADLHVWRLGPGHLAAMVTVVSHHPPLSVAHALENVERVDCGTCTDGQKVFVA